MAGRGPAPKHPDQRARTNAETTPATTLRFVRAKQPGLPRGVVWHSQTRKWWKAWGASQQATTFTSTDWDFLLDTALLHSAFWHGNAAAGAELRLRVQKFGATPEDRARLRMYFADAEPTGPSTGQLGEQPADQAGAPAATGTDGAGAARRYGDLTVVADPTT